MTLLIDPPDVPGHGRMWSHLASDESFAELHAFARGLGIPPRGFDSDHYDVPSERYAAVVRLGVTQVSSRELVTRVTAAGLRRRKGGTAAPRRPGATLQRPVRLVAGDRVAVVAPAGPVAADRLDAGLAVLGSWGLDAVVSPHVRGVHPERDYLAATDEQRAGDLTTAWCDPRVAGVLCARGGFGVQRMVDLVDWDAVRRAGPKVLVGFSDVTGLHQALAARLGWASVHGPVVSSLGAGDAASRDQLRRLLMQPEEVLDLAPDGLEVLLPGAAEGVLAGGNLSLLASSAGTRDAGTAAGAVVVLEDVGETTYRLDRALTQLLRSGWLDGVRGVVLGDLTGEQAGGGTSPASPAAEAARSLAVDRLRPLGVPVVAGAACGHGPRNLGFPLGLPVRLEASGRGSLRLLLPALA